MSAQVSATPLDPPRAEPTVPPTLGTPPTATETVTGTPPTATSTRTRIPTRTRTNTRTPTPLGNPTGTPTNTREPFPSPVPTSLPCDENFSDVAPTDWFYEFVRWIACEEIASGYADGTFRPNNSTTRAQIAKMVVLASEWPVVSPGVATFSDVPVGAPFYAFIETAVLHGIVVGYADGTFRPNNLVTRGQLSKMIVLARGWPLQVPGESTFSDVRTSYVFFPYIETAVSRGVIAGYADGTFRPGNNATRAQLSKMLYIAYTTP